MNKLKTLLAVLITSAVLVLPATAVEFRVGIAAALAAIETDGQETLKDSSGITTHKEAAQAVIPSAFFELSMDNGLGIGYENVPGEADLSASERKTVNVSEEQAAAVVGNDAGTQKASATVDGLNQLYLIKRFGSGLTLKYGQTSADVTTLESLASGSTYGNQSVDGTVMGIGWETSQSDNGFFMRTMYEVIDFDTVNLTGSQVGGTANSYNKIKADVDAQLAKISVGKVF
jgi:hypothetical protein